MMDRQKNGNTVEAFGYALALVSLLSALLVVLKEKSEAVMALMKSATGHHWITHGVLVLAAFVVIGLVLAKTMQENADAAASNRVAAAILGATIVSGLILAAFNLFWA